MLPVCDKPYHKIKENLPHVEELENNFELSIGDCQVQTKVPMIRPWSVCLSILLMYCKTKYGAFSTWSFPLVQSDVAVRRDLYRIVPYFKR